MVKVITVVPGVNPELDDALVIAELLIKDKVLVEVRPAVAMGEALEAIPASETSRVIAVDRFKRAGFEVVE